MATVDHPRLVSKAWVYYDQTGTPAIGDSENVSSVTDNSAGSFLVNWDTDFASVNYVAFGATNDEAFQHTVIYENGATSVHAVGSCNYLTVNLSSVTVDRTRNSVVAFGDL